MRFIIEQLYLTDLTGKPAASAPPKSFHSAEGEDPQGILARFIEADGAQMVGDVSVFPGYQGIVTARKGDQVYALHAYPGSDRLPIRS